MRKVRCFLMVLCLLTVMLSSTGCSDDKDDGAGYAFDYSLAANPDNLDPQMAESEEAFTVIKNMYRGLFELSSDGTIVNDLVSTYEISADGLMYTFELKDNCYWYDYNIVSELDDDEEYNGVSVTAKDFVFAFQRIFNPDMHSPYSNDYSFIKNGEAIINGTMDYTQLGVYANSDYELIIQLDKPSTEFITLLSRPATMPCNEEFFNSTKGRYGLDKQSVISNGSFYVYEWFYDQYGPENLIIMKRNSLNYESERVYPIYLTFNIEKSQEDVLSNFTSTESECMVTSSNYAKFQNKEDYKMQGYQTSSIGLVFNTADEVCSNANIRKAFSLSINRDAYNDDLKDTAVNAAYGIIPSAVTLLNKSYRELSSENNMASYNLNEAKNSLATGMNELGISSLDSVKILVKEGMFDTEYMHYFTQEWQDAFGFYVGFDVLPEDDYNSALETGAYSIAFYELTANYNSACAFLDNFKTGNNIFGYSNPQLDSMLNDAKYALTANSCVDIYSRAEKMIIDDFAYVPLFYKKEYFIWKSNCEDVVYIPFSGAVDFQNAKYYED